MRQVLKNCRAHYDEFDKEEKRSREKELKIKMTGTQIKEVGIELIMCFICKEPLENPRVTFCCENLICFNCFPENGSTSVCCSQLCKKIELIKPSGFYLRKLKTVIFNCTAEECQVKNPEDI